MKKMNMQTRFEYINPRHSEGCCNLIVNVTWFYFGFLEKLCHICSSMCTSCFCFFRKTPCNLIAAVSCQKTTVTWSLPPPLPHLGDVFHVATGAGEAVVVITPIQGKREVRMRFGHATVKHCRLSHTHWDVRWLCAVLESTGAWSFGGGASSTQSCVLSWSSDWVINACAWERERRKKNDQVKSKKLQFNKCTANPNISAIYIW